MLSDVVSPLLNQLWWELLHRHRDSEEEMSGPGDSARHRREVPNNWGLLLLLLVVILDLLNLITILLEEQVILGLKAVLERGSVEDALELA